MSQQIVEVTQRVIGCAPEWIRQDLVAKEPAARVRAEEALSAMIAAALQEQSAEAEPAAC